MNELGCYFLLAVILALILDGVRFGVKDRDGDLLLVSTNNVILLLFFFYVFFSASLSVLFDGFHFTWVPRYSGADNALPILSIATFALASYLIVYHFIVNISGNRSSTFQSPEPNSMVTMLAVLLTLIGLALKIYVLLESGGLGESVTRMSGGLAGVYGMASLDTSVTTLANLSGIAEAASCWMLVTAIRRRRFVAVWGMALLTVLSFAYLSQPKRSILIEPLVAVTIAFSYYVKKLRSSMLPIAVIGIFAFGMGSLFIRAVLPATFNSVDINFNEVSWAHGSLIGFYVYSLEYATFEAMTVAIYEADKLVEIFGGRFSAFYTTNIEPFLYIIPRALWEGKPDTFYDLSQGVCVLMLDLPLHAGMTGIAPTYIGAAWALGGIFGLTAFSALIAWVAALNDLFLMRSVSRNKDTAIIVYSIVLFAAFQLMRQGGSGYVFMIVVPHQFGYLLGFGLLYMTSNLAGKSYQRNSPLTKSDSVRR